MHEYDRNHDTYHTDLRLELQDCYIDLTQDVLQTGVLSWNAS